MKLKRVTRTIVITGNAQWVDKVLDNSYLTEFDNKNLYGGSIKENKRFCEEYDDGVEDVQSHY